MSQADKWSDYWANEGASGEVFVGRDGSKNPHLTSFWRIQFSGLAPASRIMDLAAGAGSVYSHLPDSHGLTLYATDLSLQALQLLKTRRPDVRSVACSATTPSFPDASFDLVVSQFGVEYAGTGAFQRAADLVARSGRLAILCHYRDGYIDSRNRHLLEGARKALETGFIDHAIDMTQASFRPDIRRFETARRAFIPVERELSAYVRTNPQGVHAHLYAGFRQLFENREQYDADDIVQWLVAMKGDIEKNISRLSQMRQAASSEDSIRRICREYAGRGLRKVAYSPFSLPEQSLPVAWSITACRPA